MNLKFKNFIYNQMKEIQESRRSAGYIIKHILEIIACSISLIRIFFGIASFQMKDTTFQYWQNDPFTYYFYVIFPQAYIHYSIIFAIYFLMVIIGIIVFFFQRTDTMTYKVLFELVIDNSDQLKQCLFEKKQQQNLLLKHYERELSKMKNNFLWQLAPSQFVIKQFYLIWVRIKFEMSGKKYNHFKLKQYKFQTVKDVSINCRFATENYVQVCNIIYYILLLCPGILAHFYHSF